MDLTEEFGYDISKVKSYAGFAKDFDQLKSSASGGMITAISRSFIQMGGVVFGVKYGPDFRTAEFCLAEKLEDLEALRNSKYIFAEKKVNVNGEYVSVYKVLEDELNKGKKVLFTGLGCDVAAVYGYCEKNNLDTTNLYTIDLICHGPTSPEVAKQYLDGLEKKYKSPIKNFHVRYKKEGWSPRYIRAEFESGKVYETLFHESDFGKAFYIYPRKSCLNCNFRGKNHPGDITVGDHWGVDTGSSVYNKYGVSVATVNREAKGEEIISFIDKETFHIEETDTIKAVRGNTNFYLVKPKHPNYDKFEELLKTKGLHHAVRKSYLTKDKIADFKYKLKKTVKAILKWKK